MSSMVDVWLLISVFILLGCFCGIFADGRGGNSSFCAYFRPLFLFYALDVGKVAGLNFFCGF